MARINNETLTIGIVAVFCGLLGAYGLRWYLQEPPVEPPSTINVPLASTSLPAGKVIGVGDIILLPLTRQQMRERQFSPDTMLNTEQIVGRTIRAAVDKGAPFETTNFYPEGMGPSLADRLKPGYRAVTVSIENEGALEGFAGPGSKVDVLFRSRSRTESREFDEVRIPETTITLLEGVEVLALGRNAAPGTVASRNNDSVTLAVTAQQAAALKAVEGRGELSLVLRSDEEPKTAAHGSDRVTLDGLLGIAEPPKPFTAEIYRGGTRQTLGFERATVRDESFGGIDLYRTQPIGGQPLENKRIGIAGAAPTAGNPSTP